MAKKYIIEVVEEKPKTAGGCLFVLAMIIAIIWIAFSGSSEKDKADVKQNPSKTEVVEPSSQAAQPTGSASTNSKTAISSKPETKVQNRDIPVQTAVETPQFEEATYETEEVELST